MHVEKHLEKKKLTCCCCFVQPCTVCTEIKVSSDNCFKTCNTEDNHNPILGPKRQSLSIPEGKIWTEFTQIETGFVYESESNFEKFVTDCRTIIIRQMGVVVVESCLLLLLLFHRVVPFPNGMSCDDNRDITSFMTMALMFLSSSSSSSSCLLKVSSFVIMVQFVHYYEMMRISRVVFMIRRPRRRKE